MKERALIERGEENRERKGGTLEKERGMDGGRGTQREREVEVFLNGPHY